MKCISLFTQPRIPKTKILTWMVAGFDYIQCCVCDVDVPRTPHMIVLHDADMWFYNISRVIYILRHENKHKFQMFVWKLRLACDAFTKSHFRWKKSHESLTTARTTRILSLTGNITSNPFYILFGKYQLLPPNSRLSLSLDYTDCKTLLFLSVRQSLGFIVDFSALFTSLNVKVSNKLIAVQLLIHNVPWNIYIFCICCDWLNIYTGWFSWCDG